jgi:HD-GYP domain-containing protein (c-di-GMP phosphodiesterase class II)
MSEISLLAKRRIDVSRLELGMYVCELDRPWSETQFLFQGFPLLTREDLQAVRSICEFVYVDEYRRVIIKLGSRKMEAADAEKQQKTAAVSAPPQRNMRPLNPSQQVKREPLAAEVQKARVNERKTSTLIKDMFFDIQLGRGIDTGACRAVVRENLESMMRNESALLWLSRMKSQDDYTGQHCLAVSVMAMGFGRYLGIPQVGLEQLGLSGLLHDVGKIKIDSAILNKPGKLTEQEFAVMKAHPGMGRQLLIGHRDLPPIVIDAVYGHHERPDGRGYPRQLGAELIARFTRIISIVDTFDAITSNRIYDSARSVKDAFKILMEMRDRQFDAELVLHFIEWLGIFPVGTLVQLHTGEVGLVVEKNPSFKLRPKVVVLMDQEGQRCPPKFMDMAKICVDSEGVPYRITASLPDGAKGLSLVDPEVQALLDDRELESINDQINPAELLDSYGDGPAADRL